MLPLPLTMGPALLLLRLLVLVVVWSVEVFIVWDVASWW